MARRDSQRRGWPEILNAGTGSLSYTHDLQGSFSSGQFFVAVFEPGKVQRDTDAFFRRLIDDEGGGLAGPHLVDQLVFHDDFGDATGRQAAHEAGTADIGLIDFEAEAVRQQHAERCDDAQEPALAVGGLEHDHDQIDVGLVLGGAALPQSALLAARAGWRLAAQLPIAVLGFDDALRLSARAKANEPKR